jgi:hypothetical protein
VIKVRLCVRLRLIAITALAAIALLPGCNSGDSSKETGQVQDEISRLSEPPIGYGMIGSLKVQFVKGSYRWNNAIADAPSPVDLVKHLSRPLDITNGTTMSIQFNAETKPDSVSVFLWNERNQQPAQIPISEDTIQLPAEPGKYIYDIVAKWSENEVHYVAAFMNKYVDMETAMKLGKQMDPKTEAVWSAKLVENKEIEKQTYTVWEVTAVYPAGNKMIVTIDAVTGKQLVLGEIEANM